MAKILASSMKLSFCLVSQPTKSFSSDRISMSSDVARFGPLSHCADFSSSPIFSIRSVFSIKNSTRFSSGSAATTRLTTIPHAGATATLYSGSEDAANSIGPVTIYTAADGKPVQFQGLWNQENGVALVAFLRHFGCAYCWEFAGQLRDAKPKLDAAGVKLITIGVGKPDKAQLMAEKVNFPIECLYCDEERKAYRALELPGDAGTFFFPKKSPIPKLLASMDAIRGVLASGYQISAPDDKTGVMQQGGLYIFKGQEVLYARKEEHVGDHPDLKEILGVCCTIPEYA